MKRHECCCEEPGCEIDSDDFDRANSDDPGSKWHEVSGDYDIVDNELHTITPGVLATTACHPSRAPLGSFWSWITLVNIGSGNTYKIRCGHPNNSTYEVTVVFSGTGGSTSITVTVDGDDTIEWEYAWEHRVDEDECKLNICYAPGVQLSAGISVMSNPPNWVTTPIGDDNAARCHSIGYESLGNYSILEGDFDDWEYEIHWIEDHTCWNCDCCCREAGPPEVIRGIPDDLELTISDGSDCERPVGTYAMQRRSVLPGGSGWPCIEEESSEWTENDEWWTDTISISNGMGDEWKFRIGISCNRAISDDRNTGDITDWICKFGFEALPDDDPGDCTGADFWWCNDLSSGNYPCDYEGDSTTFGDNATIIAVISGTCSPFYLRLPSLHADDYTVCEGEFASFMNLEVALP